MSAKKDKVLPVALADEDLEALDRCIQLDTAFPPKRSVLACALLRFGMDRLLSGQVSIQSISHDYGEPYTSDIAGSGRR